MTDLVRLERRGHVGVVTMQRAEKKNAFNDAMYRAMTQALNTAQADADVHVLLITGAGDAFCAGRDIGEMASADADQGFPAFRKSLTDCEKPMLTAVNGV